MKLLKILTFFLFTSMIAHGQIFQPDSFMKRVSSKSISPDDKDFSQPLIGAENYIKSLLGDTIYNDHIKVNFKQTEKDTFLVYVGKSPNSKFLGSYVYFNIHFYMVYKNDTLSYFDLFVDSSGKLAQYDKNDYFSNTTKLILNIKNLLSNKFKVDFEKAIIIGKQHGFHRRPFFNYQSANKGCYWRFSDKLIDGMIKILDINAKTGVVGRELYLPNVEK